MSPLHRACIGVLCGALAGCSVMVSLHGLSGGGEEVAPDEEGLLGADASADPGPSLAGDAGDPPAHDGGDAGLPCPGTAGPVAIRIGDGTVSFCIDTTEVTNSQYAAFLASSPSASAQPAICSWNATFTPQDRWPFASGEEDLPVGGVDWCDARAYCAWAGKRLCGKIGGGSLAPSERRNTSRSEWMYACTLAGTREYPYGSTYVPAACVGEDSTGPRPASVGTSPGCVGGPPGLFDMSGNIAEWDDSCVTSAGGPDDSCAYRGGEFFHSPEGLTCREVEVFPRNNTAPWGGIRCCGS
ncbi:MAG: SUMF1/EgtB/PvdO family nonheme iron enzyme [Labilithrix sp.]|nr:SUMF1/EgtB/PvdO family nonheme iron enzyme [Labilithrix sp.]